MVNVFLSDLMYNTFCWEKRNTPKDAAWDALQSPLDSFSYNCAFCFENATELEAIILEYFEKLTF